MCDVYIDRSFALAEGPVFCDETLWFVDILTGTLNRYLEESGIIQSRFFGDYLGFAVPFEKKWILGLRNKLVFVEWDTGEVADIIVVDGIDPGMRINDGKIDSCGRLFFGTLSLTGNESSASLYTWTESEGVHVVESKIGLSNGLAWSANEDFFYHVDTLARTIYRYNYRSGFGITGDREVFFRFSDDEGYPDGICLNKAGFLYVALWGGSSVCSIDTSNPESREKFYLPIRQPSSCCFNSDESILYVTSAREGLSLGELNPSISEGKIYRLSLEKL